MWLFSILILTFLDVKDDVVNEHWIQYTYILSHTGFLKNI